MQQTRMEVFASAWRGSARGIGQQVEPAPKALDSLTISAEKAQDAVGNARNPVGECRLRVLVDEEPRTQQRDPSRRNPRRTASGTGMALAARATPTVGRDEWGRPLRVRKAAPQAGARSGSRQVMRRSASSGYNANSRTIRAKELPSSASRAAS